MGRRWGAFAMLCACLGAATPAAPQGSGGPRFEIRAYVFDGATLIPPARLREATAPFTGPGRDFGDVQHALEAVEKLYARSGYSAVQVLLPEQELERGEVRLRIVEARLGRVIVEGNRHFSDANIRASVPSLAPGEAPNIVEVGRNLRVANENPSKQATVLLRSGEQEASVDAVVRVSDEPPLRQSLTVDNTGTPETGWLRVGYGVQYANGADLDHVLTFQIVGAPYKSDDPNSFSGTPSDRVLIVGAGVRIPLYGLGDALDFTAGYSNVDSGVIGGDLFTVSGAGGLFSTRYTHYLDRREDYDQRLALAWDIRGYHFKDVRSVATGEQLQPDITVRPLSLTYAGLLRHVDGETSLSLGVSRNLPGGRDGSPEDFCQLPPNAPHGVSRTDGMGNCPDPWYVLWRGSFNHIRALPGNWQFRFEASGQGTKDMLVAGEQFGIGGANSVRGFQERAVADDKGWQGTLELYTPEFGRALELGAARLRALAFYDWGAVRRNMPAPGDVAAQGIASAGFGLRLNRGNRVNARFDIAWVLDPGGVPGIPPDEGTYRARGQHMAHFALSVVF